MLRLPAFSYRPATSIAEAAKILSAEGANDGKARVVAGGTDLWPNMKRRHQKAETVVGLASIPELSGVSANGSVVIGSATTLTDVESHPAIIDRFPGLATAVRSISSPPLRNMGTIGGNLCLDTRCTYYNQTEEWRRSINYCMKEEGSVCWVAPSSPRCWAHSASDSAPMFTALNARVRLVSADSEREIPVEELFHNDGMAYLTKRPDEILTQVVLPAESEASTCRSAFWKLRRRGSIDFAVLSAAAALWTAPDGVVTDARVVLGSVASYPVVAKKVAEILIGNKLSEELIAEAAAQARKHATPMDNTDFQAQWRGSVVGKYVEGALREAAGFDIEGLRPRHR